MDPNQTNSLLGRRFVLVTYDANNPLASSEVLAESSRSGNGASTSQSGSRRSVLHKI